MRTAGEGTPVAEGPEQTTGREGGARQVRSRAGPGLSELHRFHTARAGDRPLELGKVCSGRTVPVMYRWGGAWRFRTSCPAAPSKPELPAHTVAGDQSPAEGNMCASLLRVSFSARDLTSAEPSTRPPLGLSTGFPEEGARIKHPPQKQHLKLTSPG